MLLDRCAKRWDRLHDRAQVFGHQSARGNRLLDLVHHAPELLGGACCRCVGLRDSVDELFGLVRRDLHPAKGRHGRRGFLEAKPRFLRHLLNVAEVLPSKRGRSFGGVQSGADHLVLLRGVHKRHNPGAEHSHGLRCDVILCRQGLPLLAEGLCLPGHALNFLLQRRRLCCRLLVPRILQDFALRLESGDLVLDGCVEAVLRLRHRLEPGRVRAGRRLRPLEPSRKADEARFDLADLS